MIRVFVNQPPHSVIYQTVYQGEVVSEDEMTLTLRVETATITVYKENIDRVETL